MAAYILVKAVDGFGSEPMTWQRGYPVDVRDHNRIGGKQVPPNFVQVCISDATVEEVEAYCREWRRAIDWEVVNSNLIIDGWRLRVFAKAECVSVSGLGKLTGPMVENWLTRWGCQNVIPSDNSVQFDVLIYDAICSEGLWEAPVSELVTFEEKSYDQATGIHRVEVTCGTWSQHAIESRVVDRGGTVVVANATKVTFEIHRQNVLDAFKAAVREVIEGPAFQRRRFAFEAAEVNAALANNDPDSPDYATLTLTRQEAALLIHNRLDD